jgi:predicted transcriptional regulator
MKSKITFILDKELHDFLKQYAKQNHRSVTQVLVDYIFSLFKKQQEEKDA